MEGFGAEKSLIDLNLRMTGLAKDKVPPSMTNSLRTSIYECSMIRCTDPMGPQMGHIS